MTKRLGTTATTALVEQRGSLNLLQENGVLLVQLRDAPHKVETLRRARDWHLIDNTHLNGSQVATVREWVDAHGA